MDNKDFERMSEIFFGIIGGDNTEISDDDKEYFLNRLTPFHEELVNQATKFLNDKFGVPTDLAFTIVMSTSMAARMSGANSFHDFIITERLAEC